MAPNGWNSRWCGRRGSGINVEIPTQLKSSLTVQGDEDKAYHSQNLVAEPHILCRYHNYPLHNRLVYKHNSY